MIVHAQLSVETVEATGVIQLCATCTRCKSVASVTVVGSAHKTKPAVIAKLQETCPKDEHNAYVERVIPLGVRLWYPHPGTAKLYPLDVTRRIVHGAQGAVPPTTAILVVPDDKGQKEAATDFASQLRKWGYSGVELKPAGYQHVTPPPIPCVS